MKFDGNKFPFRKDIELMIWLMISDMDRWNGFDENRKLKKKKAYIYAFESKIFQN